MSSNPPAIVTPVMLPPGRAMLIHAHFGNRREFAVCQAMVGLSPRKMNSEDWAQTKSWSDGSLFSAHGAEVIDSFRDGEGQNELKAR